MVEDPRVNDMYRSFKGVPINLYDWRALRLSVPLSSHEIMGSEGEEMSMKD